MKRKTTALLGLFALLLVGAAAPRSAAAQSDILLQLRSGSPAGDRMRVDSAGGLVAMGGLGYGIIPASGPGVRMMWHPFKAAFRAGGAGNAGQWNDANIGFYSWAGGNETVASSIFAFAMGDRTTASGQTATAFGTSTTASGSASFAQGFTTTAGGAYSIGMGYSSVADGDYSVALGYRASTNGRGGAFVWGGRTGTTGTDVVQAQADGEFRIRAPGGIRLRTSNAASTSLGASGNTGCDLPAGSGVFSCSSSRTLKDSFQPVNGEDVLARLRSMPVTTWKFTGEEQGIRHLGPVAEDFHQAFGLGDSETMIPVTDLAGVGVAAAQALERRTAELSAENAALSREVAELRARMAEMESRQAEMHRALESLLRK